MIPDQQKDPRHLNLCCCFSVVLRYNQSIIHPYIHSSIMSNPNDDMGEYAKLGQSLVAPEGQLPTTSATVSSVETLS